MFLLHPVKTRRPLAHWLVALALFAVVTLPAMFTAATAAVVTNAQGFWVVTNPPATVTLAWDFVTDGRVTGYRLFGGPASKSYTNTWNVGNTNYFTVTNLVRGLTNYFAVTAYTTNLESAFSAEVSYAAEPLPLPPGGLRTAYFTLLASPDMNLWCEADNFALPVWTESDYFRLRIVAVK